MATQALPPDAVDVIGPDTYAEHGYPHEAWARLRREDPVHWTEHKDTDPFWAVTKHADIQWVSRQPRRLQNGPRLAVFPEFEAEPQPEPGQAAHHLLTMDPPEHARYRKIASKRFTPRSVEALRESVERITREVLDEAAGDGSEREGDFVQSVSARIPLAVLADLLGVPRSDWELMFRWTNMAIGAADPEYAVSASPTETVETAQNQLFEYFQAMVEERRRRPTDDIVSLIANAKMEGEPLPPLQLLSYYFLLVVAGNETTRNAMSGGLLAFVENPGEWEKVQRDPELVPSAVEEIVRWTTPVIQFCRTATEDLELRGRRIRAGESLCLFYPSANRDEEVFEEPFAFRVDRKPNPHLAFGIGEHVCLGANLARLELRVLLQALRERLEHVELAGRPERLRSSFVGGIKRVPIRYRIRPAAQGRTRA